MSLRTGIITFVLLTAAAVSSGRADAADLPGPAPVIVETEGGWRFSAAPYLWAAGLEGSIGQFGLPPLDVDLSFLDVMKNFDIGFMMAAEARYDRFAIFSDIIYVKLSAEADTPLGVVADGVDLTSRMFTALTAGSYRVVETEQGTLDVLAGGRLWWVDADSELVNSPLPKTSFSDGDTWVDPVIGVSGRINLSPEFYLTGWAMVGGFGAASSLTWDLMGGAGYVVNDSVSVLAGYRALSVDYTSGDFVFDVVQQGPFLGARLSF